MKSAAHEPTAQSLLEFMEIASDAVKCALKKPTAFKRNINHRRYLQRQVKTVVRNRKKSRKVNPCELREDVQDLVREAIKELKFSHCYANAFGTLFHESRLTQSPQHISANFVNSRPHNSTSYRLSHLPLSKPKIDPFYSLDALPKVESCQYSTASQNTEEEYFMSGEELTNNLDINDLYIPELHEPRSPEVNCEDYFLENELEIPSPVRNDEHSSLFEYNTRCSLVDIEQFL